LGTLVPIPPTPQSPKNYYNNYHYNNNNTTSPPSTLPTGPPHLPPYDSPTFIGGTSQGRNTLPKYYHNNTNEPHNATNNNNNDSNKSYQKYAGYDETDTKELFGRLTEENKLRLLKELLERHPQEYLLLTKLSDQTENIVESIEEEFQRIEDGIEVAIRPDLEVMESLDPNRSSPWKKDKYREDLETRAQNNTLDDIVKDGIQLQLHGLGTILKYLDQGKTGAALTMLLTRLEEYIKCSICKEGYAYDDEETELADSILKCVAKYTELKGIPPQSIKQLIFKMDAFKDNINDETVRTNFIKKYQNLKKKIQIKQNI